MRRNRDKDYSPHEMSIVHISHRCARQLFLLDDGLPAHGDMRNRRDTILERLKWLVRYFAIDVWRVVFMNNHVHMIMRNRPDLVKMWTDLEVAQRWMMICPGYSQALYDFLGKEGEPATIEVIEALARNKKRIAELRERLSDFSWFMWAFSDYSAKLFNLIDGAKGKFWDPRFHCRVLVDEVGILLGGLYVDLNPIRAAMAATPEESLYTSAYWQIEAMEIVANDPERALSPSSLPDAFLAPTELKKDAEGPMPSENGCRASDRGFLSISSEEYLIVLDLVGRILHPDKRGSIPTELPPIFERLKLRADNLAQLVQSYQHMFRSLVGSPESLKARKKKRPSCDSPSASTK